MHFDIIEAIRQKQHKQQRRISIENGDVIDMNIADGKVVVRRAAARRLERDEEIEPEQVRPGTIG